MSYRVDKFLVAVSGVLCLLLLTDVTVFADPSRGDVDPNPFTSGGCTFYLSVPPPGSKVHVAVYDILGRRVQTLFPTDGSMEPAYHQPGQGINLYWDGNDWLG